MKGFNKKIIILIALFLIIASFNVYAKTVLGTKYTTNYDPEKLKKVFGYVDEKKVGSSLTGDIVVGDDAEDIYGIIAGDISVKDFTSKVKKVEIKSNNKNKALYYNLDKSLKSQGIKSDILRLENSPSKFEISSVKGGIYYQHNVAICDNCEFVVNPLDKDVSLNGLADVMSLETYKNKVKAAKNKWGNKWKEKLKLNDWELLEIGDIGSLHFYDGKYELSGNFQKNKGKATFALRGVPETYFGSSYSTFGPLKLQGPLASGDYTFFTVLSPLEKDYNEPVYLLKGHNIRIPKLPEKILLHVDLLAFSTSPGAIIEDLNIYGRRAPHVMYAINKGVQKKSSEIECPLFFKNYNCMTIDSNGKINIDYLDIISGKLISPITRREIKKSENHFLVVKNDKNLYQSLTLNSVPKPVEFVTITKSIGGKSYSMTVWNDAINLVKRWDLVGVDLKVDNLPNKDNLACYYQSKKCYINSKEVFIVAPKKGYFF